MVGMVIGRIGCCWAGDRCCCCNGCNRWDVCSCNYRRGNRGRNFFGNASNVGESQLVGAITGLIGASSISRIGSTFVGAVIGGGSNIASQLLDGKSFSEINWKTVGLSTIVGGVSGFIGGAGAKNTKAFQRSLSRNSGWNKAMSSFYKVQGKIAAGVYSKSGAAGANALVNYMLSQAYINALKQFEKQAIRSALKIYGIFTGTQAFTLALFEIFEVEFFA